MKKKLIFVTEALWIGGIETALINLLNRMDYEKYDVTLLVLRASLEFADRIHPNCRLLVADREEVYSFKTAYKYSRLYHLTEKTDNPSGFHKAMMWTVPAIRWIENRLYIRYIKEQLQVEHYDTAIIYSDRTAETTVRAVNADQYLMFYHHGAMRRSYHDEIGYRLSSKVIAVSETQAESLRKFRSKYADKIISIHNLIDVDGIREKAQESINDNFETDKFNLVSVGRVSHEKGMDLAVRVCARLVDAGHTNIRWWIVGDGPAMQEVRDVITECHIEDYVITVGMKNNPYPYIKKADLYVQPSRFEGYPMTILEALVLGQPVVSTDNNGAKEILHNSVTGVLTEIDALSIARVLNSLISNSALYAYMKKNVTEIDFEKENKESIQTFESLIE